MTELTHLPDELQFIAYIDKLKSVERKNALFDGSRDENVAEHSWHAALSALLLKDYPDEPVDINLVIRMLLVHDLVEIEAGDAFIYDPEELAQQEEAEREAAEIVFSKLPPDQVQLFKDLWDEFESRQTPESRFAKAIDRFMPIYSNIGNGGFLWRTFGITRAQIRVNIAIIREGSSRLADLADRMVDQAVEEGRLSP